MDIAKRKRPGDRPGAAESIPNLRKRLDNTPGARFWQATYVWAFALGVVAGLLHWLVRVVG